MLESIMYFGIGFLFAALVGLAIFPRVHGRAVRLTTRRLEAAILPSIKEVQAVKDRLTAAGKEVNAEGDVAPRAPIEWPTALAKVPVASSQSPPVNDQRHEGDVVSPVPKQWPTFEIARPDRPARDPVAGRNSSDQGTGSVR